VSTFAGKVALVTGGTRGLSLAAAHAFVRRGARVVISARSHDQGQQAVEELRRTGVEACFIPRGHQYRWWGERHLTRRA
jgi:NAD(P)-dependent dehydrogenase (short-subunit alcohol dehydrogenase family)